jgi:hypothetical protein
MGAGLKEFYCAVFFSMTTKYSFINSEQCGEERNLN